MTKRNQKNIRHQVSLSEFQHSVRKTWGTLHGFVASRTKLKTVDVYSAALWLKRTAHTGVGPFAHFRPSSVTRLGTRVLLPKMTCLSELNWAAATFSAYQAELSQFVVLASDYELAILTGAYELGEHILNQLDEALGPSLWTIENRFALYQLHYGLERQKELLTTILDSKPTYNLLPYLCHNFSRRNEEATTPGRFTDGTRTVVQELKIEQGLRNYICYRLLNDIPDSPEEIGELLRYESSANIIDYYDTFVRVIHEIAAVAGDYERGSVSQILTKMVREIPDTRLAKALFTCSGATNALSSIPCRELTAENYLSVGHPDEALRTCESIARTHPKDMYNLLLLAVAAFASNQTPNAPSDTLGGQLILRLHAIVSKSNLLAESVLFFAKAELNYRLLPFSATIGALAWYEFDEEPLLRKDQGLKVFLNSPYLDLLVRNQEPHSDAYYALLENRYGNAIALKLFLHAFDSSKGSEVELEGAAEDSATYVLTCRAFDREQYDRASSHASLLAKSGDARTRRIGERFIASCLKQLPDPTDLINFIVDAYLRDPAFVAMLPVSTCAQRLTKQVRKQLVNQLSTPIALDIYCKEVSEQYSAERNYAFEDFLISQGLSKPSELRSRIEHYSKPELIYFLREMARPEVMQTSTTFNSSKDLEDERIAVCSILTEFDFENAKIYETEARDITRSQLIRRSVRQVEQSKIYVDLQAIRRWADKELKESFARYQALIRLGAGLDTDALIAAINDALFRRTPLPKQLFEVPKNEAYEILVKLVLSICRECMSNAEHGLDCYLSMRIRHGTLSGQLRSPLEEHHLITQRKGGSDDYVENSYWMTRLYDIAPPKREAVLSRLNAFSREYDEFIAQIANEFIQVRSERKPDGKFDVQTTHIRLRTFATSISGDTSFERFLDLTFDLFWELTETCLSAIRDLIGHTLKPQLTSIFQRLDNDIASIVGSDSCADLARHLKLAHTAAHISLDRVTDWFHLPAPVSEPLLTLEQLIDVGLEMVQSIHRAFRPRLEKRLVELPPFQEALTTFSDIFFIIFDNIQRHSGYSDPKVTLEVEDHGSTLSVRVENDVQPSAITDAARVRIEKIKASAFGSGYARALATEGGTGLIKLLKIVGRDRESASQLDFDFVGDNRFFVQFNIKKMELQI